MTITSGPELDAAMAKAINLEGNIRRGVYRLTWRSERELRREPLQIAACEPEGKSWQPSTDLNASFEAAEKFGLFINHYPAAISRNDYEWIVVLYGDTIHGRGPTPALAICAAILALKPT